MNGKNEIGSRQKTMNGAVILLIVSQRHLKSNYYTTNKTKRYAFDYLAFLPSIRIIAA
jgi:hypothetical protein